MSADNMALAAAAATRLLLTDSPLAVQQLIDICSPPTSQQQSCHSSERRLDGTDRQTDAQQLHRPCSAYYMDSAKQVILLSSTSPLSQHAADSRPLQFPLYMYFSPFHFHNASTFFFPGRVSMDRWME